MLGQPISMLIPEVVGFKLTGSLQAGITATDLVLTVTQMLRKKGVVGKFVEFFGPGLDSLTLPDRATIANMAPEYGATMGFFPVDQKTLDYLKLSGRSKEVLERVETYCKAQGLFLSSLSPDPVYSDLLELDLGTVEASLAGPKRPQDRIVLKDVQRSFQSALTELVASKPDVFKKETANGGLHHGDVVIAAITSCTNTSNPSVMLGAGLLAKKAVARGLRVKPWVKTSLAPGSKVVMEYLKRSHVLEALEQLHFNLVGFGCTTCIGNSGPLPDEIAQQVTSKNLLAVSVLSGNRNFEGRVNPLVRANYLASPPLVVTYAIAGTVNIDLTREPLGQDASGKPVFLRDIWPSEQEIEEALKSVDSEMYRKQYASVFEGDAQWKALHTPTGDTFAWDAKSTYVKFPPYFEGMALEAGPLQDINNARALVVCGDSVTTDHISPAGSIAKDSPAGKYLTAQGIAYKDFNSYGARRGNHEIMVRGTFANVRFKNLLAPGKESCWTTHFPSSEIMPIFDAAEKYKKEGVPLIVIAGKEYGTGSSRDWAAKGPALLGVRVAIAESFERIHRSNLIGMGILPLQFEAGQNRETLKLSGEEIFSFVDLKNTLKPRARIQIQVKGASSRSISCLVRIDTPEELAYFQHGGILRYVLRQLIKKS
jgi:aconitate hydratase